MVMKKNAWHSVDGHAEIWVAQYIVPNFVSNSVLIEIDETNLMVISPGKPLLDHLPEKFRNPDINLHIVMPNGYHYMGVKAWQSYFRKFSLYASRKAIPRLVEQGVVATEDQIFPIEVRQPDLPSGYEFLIPPGHRAGDVWLTKKDCKGALWITCDSFLNYERLSNQPLARLSQQALGAAPGLKMSQVVKWLILEDRSKFRDWVLNQLQVDQPTTLIPSHGEVDQAPCLSERLRSLILKRL
jgi:hypothetical protein